MHRLSREEFDLLNSKENYGEYDFNISNLILTIKGTNKFPQVDPKQVRIHHNFPVFRYKDWEKATKPFDNILT